MTKPGETPSLRRLEDALELIARRSPEIAEAARWAWPLGYQRRTKDRSGSIGGDVSRPTEVVVGYSSYRCEPGCGTHPDGGAIHPGSPEWDIRGQVAFVGESVLRAAALLNVSLAALEQAFKAAGRQDSPASPREEQVIRVVPKSEVTKAKQMKRWRDEERKKGMAHGEY